MKSKNEKGRNKQRKTIWEIVQYWALIGRRAFSYIGDHALQLAIAINAMVLLFWHTHCSAKYVGTFLYSLRFRIFRMRSYLRKLLQEKGAIFLLLVCIKVSGMLCVLRFLFFRLYGIIRKYRNNQFKKKRTKQSMIAHKDTLDESTIQ